MQSKTIFFLILWTVLSFSTQLMAGGQAVYLDGFNGRHNSWWIGQNKTGKAEIRDGKYIMQQNDNNHNIFYSYVSIPEISPIQDFSIEMDINLVAGDQNRDTGMIWLDNTALMHCYYAYGPTGKFAYARKVHNQWVIYVPLTDSLHVRKGNGVTNSLKVAKNGTLLHMFVNGQKVKTVPYEPFFIRKVGPYIWGNMHIEVDRIKVIVEDKSIPDGWEIIHRGNFMSSVTRDKPSTNSAFKKFNTILADNSSVQIQRAISGSAVVVSAEFSAPKTRGTVFGVFLKTKDGASLKLERIEGDTGSLARFAAFFQGKPSGKREIPLGSKVAQLQLERSGDIFKGIVTDGNRVQQIGALTWPSLSQSQTIGFSGSYEPIGKTNPKSVEYKVKKTRAGKL